MLDQTTKRKIDSARQILVGKVPDPKAQVEQITTALIYKFMDDMDKESEELGGKAKFFTHEFAQYAWTKLMDQKLSGQDRLDLYRRATMNMPKNPHIPQLFRTIFKDAFLPYNDPRTLSLFLKEINEFSYEHSENLGNAFEYLLSILGSQGDAGQFRTPRHIIDFIVEVVDPKKNETILDPACGTAGFLISAYKHILKQNKEKTLTPDEKTRLMNNVAGYDISPDMVKLALVNMYLHGFPEPKIYEYDCLTSEKRWDETFDVILANPPFMTPKGGIVPHKRFSIQANRSEVLFVDYIMEHLTIKGRAGIIVPEGIIFQSANAYKALRKKLVKDGLYAIVSLPSGVFQPYSGVKTSILFFDKELTKRTDELLFIKVENDGFDLGAQRRQIEKNDLPQAVEILQAWKNGKKQENTQALWVKKIKIAENDDCNLSCDRYRIATDHTNAKWSMVELKKICALEYGKPLKQEVRKSGEYPVYGSNGIVGYHNEYLVKAPFIIIGRKGTAGAVVYSEKNGFPIDTTFYVKLFDKNKTDTKYLYYILGEIGLSKLHTQAGVPGLNRNDAYKLKIPLPPIEVQKQIVAELDGYAGIIAGAKQIAQNWKPKIDIDPEWERVKIGNENILQIIDGDRGINYPNKEDFKPEGFSLFLNTGNVRKGAFDFSKCVFISKEKDKELKNGKLNREDVVLTTRGTIGNTAYYSKNITFENIRINSGMVILRSNVDKISPNFLLLFLNSLEFEVQVLNFMSGSAQPQLPIRVLNEIEITLPPLEIQKQIVKKIEAERALVESTKKLIEIYEQKTKETIAKLWKE